MYHSRILQFVYFVWTDQAYKVTPEFVGSVFEKFIMPLTREVEVDYLLNYVPVVADAK